MIDLMQKRRSIRAFQTKPVEPEKIEKLLQAGLLSPSSRSLFPCRFIVVDDADLLYKLSSAKPHGASFLKNTAAGLVITADTTKSDVWVEDASIAAMNIQLAAESLGLGSCWVQIRKREHDATHSADEYVRSLLSLPENMRVEAIIALGYPAEKIPPHDLESLNYSHVYYNTYPQAYQRP